MKRCNFALAAAPALVFCLGGCTTPQVALDQANNGAGLVAQLELELNEFRRVQQGFAERTKQSILDITAASGLTDNESAASLRARRAAEDPIVPNLHDRVRGLAEAIGSDDARLAAEIAAVDERLSKALKPLPATSEKTGTAQQALAAMGAELSNSARFAELRAFFKTVKAGVDTNKEKIKAAEAATP